MRPAIVAITCTLALVALGGCRRVNDGEMAAHPAVPIAPAEDWPRTFVDDLGVEVTLPQPPTRVVSLAPGFTETLFAIGAGDRVAGRTDFCDEPAAALQIESIGGLATPSVEKIVGLEPDLVLVIRGTPADVIESLRRAGLPVIARDTRTLAEALAAIRDVGRYLGTESEANALADGLQARREAVERETRELFASRERPEVLVVVSVDPIFAAGDESLAGDIVTIAGGANAAGGPELAQAGPWPQLGLEAIVDRDPDIVVLASDAEQEGQPSGAVELATMPGWRDLTAVRRGRVHEIDPDLLSRSGPRLLDGLEQLAGFMRAWAPGDDRGG